MQYRIFYRLSPRPAAQNKEKLEFASKAACLSNCISILGDTIQVFGDRLDDELRKVVTDLGLSLIEVNEGSGGGNFRAAAMAAMEFADETSVYLVEDDFIHRPGAHEALVDGLNMGAHYVTLYDHPDKYLPPFEGGNPHVKHGGEATRLLCGQVCHWKITNSTVMTFATTAGQLKKDWKIFLKYCGGRYTDDYRLFRHLSRRGRRLISSIPGYATHCETRWVTPFFNWESLVR